MLDLLQGPLPKILEDAGRPELLPRHDMPVIEDLKLNGATSHEVREHFKLWTEGELTRILKDPTKRKGCMQRLNARGICVGDMPYPLLDDMPFHPVLKILVRDWEQPETAADVLAADSEYKACDDHGYEDGISNDPDDDVGWMYMEAVEYVDYFNRFVGDLVWDVKYMRPPGLEGYDTFMFPDIKLPGWWRKKGKSVP
ncbi:hypothetical protein BDW74DRAFT_178046 [Aspergillus multicolor]|uniref:uncharacterized protein n=1 Tax=Aspergillus multicolor TaxID=41759 RepID=UPI003CCD05D7